MSNKLDPTTQKKIQFPQKNVNPPKKNFNLIKSGKQLTYNNTKQKVSHPTKKNQPQYEIKLKNRVDH